VKNSPDFEDMNWFESVAMFGHTGDEMDKSDDDLNLIPLIAEKIMIPKLTGTKTYTTCILFCKNNSQINCSWKFLQAKIRVLY